jgi:Tfp pilus assembly protein PilO
MNEKKVTIITIICLVVILLAGGSAIYYLEFVRLKEVTAELVRVKGEVAVAEDKQSKIPGLKKSIEELKQKEQELIRQIPNLEKTEYDAFANLLDGLRRQSGVSVSRAGWTTPTKATAAPGRAAKVQPANIHKVQYGLTVTGSFYQILRYINLLEQQKRFIGIEDFTINKGGGENIAGAKATAPQRDLKITIYSYAYKLPSKPLEIEGEKPRAGKSTDIPD